MCRRQVRLPEHREHPGQGADDSAVTSAIQAKLAQDKDINWIITLGAAQAVDAIKAKEAVKSEAKIGTFDLNQETAEAVQAGDLQFCIDQQPYLQGYLAVTQLYLYKKNGNILGGGQPSLTGPSFVDHQRRRHPSVHQPEHPLVHPCPAGPGRSPRSPR